MLDILILCGGEGKRMKKMRLFTPKILYKFGGKFIFENIIKSIDKIIYNSVYFISSKKEKINISKTIKKKFDNTRIKFISESTKMGTGGYIYKNKKKFAKNMLIIFGDLIIKFDLSLPYKYFKKNDLDCLILVQNNGHYYDSDLIEFKNNDIIELYKKPHNIKKFSNSILAIEPIIFIKKELLEHFKFRTRQIDFIHDIIYKLIITKKYKFNVYNFEKHKNYNNIIVDAGVPDRYLLLKSFFG